MNCWRGIIGGLTVAHKSFSEMIDTLRAGAAAGMSVDVRLQPDAAAMLADIPQEHRDKIRDEALSALAEFDAQDILEPKDG